MSFEQFLGTSLFRYGVFPAFSITAGVLLKCLTRNDQYAFFKKEDMAVGLELILTSALIFIASTTERAQKLGALNVEVNSLLKNPQQNREKLILLQKNASELSNFMSTSAWYLFFIVIALWLLSTVVKRFGWKNEFELHPVPGIAIPLVVGVLTLIGVMRAVQS